ncbi:post-GPI attachment to proteins factor 3 [Epargyreus clarus]|uniref:post-GPI attachment to proteins factor 3 n=1 Tax=Epargyreus clarus TaxID=520877 RepID=UPI003C2DAB09
MSNCQIQSLSTGPITDSHYQYLRPARIACNQFSRKENALIMFFPLLFVVFFQITPLVLCSEGDRSPYYQNCVKNCLTANCTKAGITFLPKAVKLQDKWSRMMMWNCYDECSYHCMWKTVEGFHERGFDTPKFHGKWPFKRIMGIQEPASVFASMLNLLSTLFMHTLIIKQFPISDTPLVLFWHVFVAICMNAWTWSIVFHIRDNAYTEFMDYACALSMVMALFVAAVVRIFHKRRKFVLSVLIVSIWYYMEHAQYLYSGQVDYDYNMKVNVMFGVLGSVLWLAWAAAQWAAGRRYVWRLAAFTALSGASLALELLDFPPRYGHWDAHALWHLSTAPLPFIFYRFVIDDLTYLYAPTETEDAKTK